MDRVYEFAVTPRAELGLEGVVFRFVPDPAQIDAALKVGGGRLRPLARRWVGGATEPRAGLQAWDPALIHPHVPDQHCGQASQALLLMRPISSAGNLVCLRFVPLTANAPMSPLVLLAADVQGCRGASGWVHRGPAVPGRGPDSEGRGQPLHPPLL